MPRGGEDRPCGPPRRAPQTRVPDLSPVTTTTPRRPSVRAETRTSAVALSRGALVRLATRTLRLLPAAVADGLGRLVADLSWLVLRERRRTLLLNLTHTAAGQTPAEARRLGRQTFRNLAACTIDFLRVPLVGPARVRDLVELRGREHVEAALARGRGLILVSAHLGNWEIAGCLFDLPARTLHIVAEDDGVDPDTYGTYAAYRSAFGAQIIPRRQAAGAALRLLRQGDVIALVGDRAIGGEGVMVDFCGGRRMLPLGPAVLARRTGAPVMLWSLTLNPRGARRYLAVFDPPLDPPPSATDEAITQTIADRLSAQVRAYPDQWFVFQPEWASS
jgi:lauroyl/myristoyl acyltransferase